MGFEHAVLAAELTLAEATVTHDALGEFLAFLEGAAWLSGWGHDCATKKKSVCGRFVIKGRSGRVSTIQTRSNEGEEKSAEEEG